MPASKPATLYAALVAAQAAMGPVVKQANNPAFRSKYADLDSVLDAVRGPLNDSGLVLLQPLAIQDGRQVLKTVIVHADTGESVESCAEVRCADPDNPQKMGGAITYYRRYSILALLGLAPEDDDGQLASQPRQPQQSRNAPQTRPEPPESIKPAPRTNHIPKDAPMAQPALDGTTNVEADWITLIDDVKTPAQLSTLHAELTKANATRTIWDAYGRKAKAINSTA